MTKFLNCQISSESMSVDLEIASMSTELLLVPSLSMSLSSLSELLLEQEVVVDDFRDNSAEFGFQSDRTDTHEPNQGLARSTMYCDGRFSGKFAPMFGFLMAQQIAAAREQPT